MPGRARAADDKAALAANGDDDAPDKDDAASPAATEANDPAALKFWEAIKLLESRQADEIAAGRAALQEASDLEFVHAQVLLGNCFLSGSYGFAKDARRAINLFRLAAERGNAFAKVSLGTCYVTGTGVRRDEAKATEWLEAALDEKADFARPVPPPDFVKDSNRAGADVAGELVNDPVAGSKASAHFLLGQIRTRQKNLEEAHRHYVAAATAGPDGRSGVYQAAVEAAMNYAFGRGTPRDPSQANAMLEQSRRLNARLGVSLIHNYASLKIVDEFAVADLEEQVEEAGTGRQSTLQFQIAQGLADKKSKDYNAAEAARWYELAANSGQVWGMLSLAFLHANGDLGKADPVQAFQWFEKAATGKSKHTLGIANYGICLLQGYGTAKDEARAMEQFKKYRDQDIVCYLGTIGKAPAKIVSFDEQLRLLQDWARQKNDPHAQYLLGRRYLTGEGVKPDLAEALRWFKKAAKANDADALFQLGVLFHFRWYESGYRRVQDAARDAAENYRAAGARGHIEALANYASCLSAGFGVRQDVEAAIRTYEQCLQIDPEHSRTHSNLGQLYNQKLLQAGNAVGTADWREKMLSHYEASARQEVSYASILLGDLYYEGRLVQQDYAKAYQYFEQATTVPTSKGAAHHRLGLMHENGHGVPVTPAEAAYHYRLAALEGNVLSLRRLVNFYVSGIGVSRDFDRALYWLEYMIRLQQTEALPIFGDILIQKREYAQALRLFKLLVDDSNPAIAGHANERLSRFYAQGEGVKMNPKRAEKHFLRAVELGNGEALNTLAHRQLKAGNTAQGLATFETAARTSSVASYSLGQMYFFGTNVAVDRAKAIRYFWDAAKNSNSDAQYFLAGMTFNNEPGAPGLDEAIEQAVRAETLGNAKAADLRKKLELRRKAQTNPEDDARMKRAS